MAYDGKLGDGGLGDDSTIISNTTSSPISIDSIMVEFDTSLYDSHFEIGWLEGDRGPTIRQSKRVFNDESLAHLECMNQGTAIKDYNSRTNGKMSIGPKSSLKMFSPHFSTKCSNAGWIEDCVECWYNPNWISFFFDGRIIFVSNNHRDTLHLACEHTVWKTALSHSAAIAPKKADCLKGHAMYNALGRKIAIQKKKMDIRSIKAKNGKLLLLIN
jgi:hypothetical protein